MIRHGDTQTFQAQAGMSLGQTFVLCVQQQRNMSVLRNSIAKSFEHCNLARRGREQIPSPDDLCNAHVTVIHAHGELIGKNTVRALQIKIPSTFLAVCGP